MKKKNCYQIIYFKNIGNSKKRSIESFSMVYSTLDLLKKDTGYTPIKIGKNNWFVEENDSAVICKEKLYY